MNKNLGGTNASTHPLNKGEDSQEANSNSHKKNS